MRAKDRLLNDTDTDGSLKIFISYSRQDATHAANQLLRELQASGHAPFMDTHQILPGEDWKERLGRLIEQSGVVIFLISQRSITSPVCDWEVNEAERLGKRLLPVEVVPTQNDHIPPRLTRLQYISLLSDTHWSDDLAKIKTFLKQDIVWVREHARLLEFAAEWRRRDSIAELLLRGAALASAELWLSKRSEGGQAPTDLHHQYIQVSREAEQQRLADERNRVSRTRRLQTLIGWSLVGALTFLIAGAWGVISQSRVVAEKRTLAIAQRAKEAIDQSRYDQAIRYGLLAMPVRGALPWDIAGRGLDEARVLLSLAHSRSRLSWTISEPSSSYIQIAVSSNGERIAAITQSNMIVFINGLDGRTVGRFPIPPIATPANSEEVAPSESFRMTFDPSGKRLLLCSTAGKAFLFDPVSGRHSDIPLSISAIDVCEWSANGRYVITTSAVWDAEKRTILDLPGEPTYAKYSPGLFSKERRFNTNENLIYQEDLILLRARSANNREAGEDANPTHNSVILYSLGQKKIIDSHAFVGKDIKFAQLSPEASLIMVQLVGADGSESALVGLKRSQNGLIQVFSNSTRYRYAEFIDEQTIAALGDGSFLDFEGLGGTLFLLSTTNGGVLSSQRAHDQSIEYLASSQLMKSADRIAVLLTTISSIGTIRNSVILHEPAKRSSLINLPVFGNIGDGITNAASSKLSTGLFTFDQGKIKRWRLFDSATTIGPAAERVEFSSSGRHVIATNAAKEIELYDVERGRHLIKWKPGFVANKSDSINRLHTDLFGQRLIISLSGSLEVVNVSNSSLLCSISTGRESRKESNESAGDFDAGPAQIQFDATGSHMLVKSGTDDVISIVRLSDCTIATRPTQFRYAEAALAPSGAHVTFWRGRDWWIWDLNISAVTQSGSESADISNVLWLNDSKKFIIFSRESKRALARDARAGLVLFEFDLIDEMEGATNSFGANPPIEFTSDGKYIISQLGNPARIIVRDAQNGKMAWSTKSSLPSSGKPVTGGYYLMSGDSFSQTIISIATGRLIANSNSDLFMLAVSPDARKAVVRTPGGGMGFANLNWLDPIESNFNVEVVCRSGLRGAERFSDAELEDPILVGEDRNPCARPSGPLSWTFWSKLLFETRAL